MIAGSGGSLAALTADLPPVSLQAAPSQKEWSAIDMLGHLRSCAKLLAVLEPLPAASWSRAAMVTGAGKALQRTVLDYAQWLARHERPHVKHIERIVTAMRMLWQTSSSSS